MSKSDAWYYRQRAEAEFARAQSANEPEAVHLHRQLAEGYLDKLFMLESVLAADRSANRTD